MVHCWGNLNEKHVLIKVDNIIIAKLSKGTHFPSTLLSVCLSYWDEGFLDKWPCWPLLSASCQCPCVPVASGISLILVNISVRIQAKQSREWVPLLVGTCVYITDPAHLHSLWAASSQPVFMTRICCSSSCALLEGANLLELLGDDMIYGDSFFWGPRRLLSEAGTEQTPFFLHMHRTEYQRSHVRMTYPSHPPLGYKIKTWSGQRPHYSSSLK